MLQLVFLRQKKHDHLDNSDHALTGCRREDSNLRPQVYDTRALPTELHRQNDNLTLSNTPTAGLEPATT